MSRHDSTVERVDSVEDQRDFGPPRVRRLQLVHGPVLQERSTWPVRSEMPIGRDPGEGGVEILDPGASRRHALITLDEGQFGIEDLGSRNGTIVDGRRQKRALLVNGSVIRIADSIMVFGEAPLLDGLEVPEPTAGVSLARGMVEATAIAAARTSLTILIEGPTGAGKEVLARMIHRESGRSGPTVALNCATLSRELIGSELFGHAQGAFSGASSAREGLFVAADRGTLFLDEIAELPLDQQPTLLRAIQEGAVRPIGADRELSIDVRVIAATHGSLERMIEAGSFRRDLYARLSGFVLRLPGLTERREEILDLLARFTSRAPSADAAEALLLHDWPQNIREIQHLAAQLSIFGDVSRLELSSLPAQFGERLAMMRKQPALDEVPQRQMLESLLREHRGNVAGIAKALGKHRAQVYRWLRRESLDPEAYRED